MNRYMIVVTAALLLGIIGVAGAMSPDITKSDITITAQTKDLASAQVQVSVEWQSNISTTSQFRSNVRAMTEMAVIEEIGKYNLNELEINKNSISNNIKLNLQNKASNTNFSISDVIITKITPKNQPPAVNKPTVIDRPYIPVWGYLFLIAAFAIGYFIGHANGSKQN